MSGALLRHWFSRALVFSMNVERLILSLSLLSSLSLAGVSGCSKLNAAFSADSEGSTSAGDMLTTDTKGGDTNPNPSDPTAASASDSMHTTGPNPPGPVTSGPDPSGPGDASDSGPTDASSDASDATGVAESGTTTAGRACPQPSSQCVPFLGQCSSNRRCRPHDADGDNVPDSFGCFEAPENITEDICLTMCGPFSGTDACAADRLCDPFSNEPRCVQVCTADDGCGIGECVTDGLPGENYGICRADCNPIDQDCPAAQKCVLLEDEFTCVEPGNNFPAGSECGFAEDCAPGLACATSDPGSECGGDPCCAAYCSLAEDNCLESGFDCQAAFPKSTSNTDVGICVEQL